MTPIESTSTGRHARGSRSHFPLAIALAVLFLALIVPPPAQASTPIPDEKGFNGFVRVTYGLFRFRNNLVAGFMNTPLSEKQIDSLESRPPIQNLGLLTFPAEFGFTLVPSKTQIFIGNQLEDLVRFDVSQQAGIKQRIGSAGVLNIAYLFSGLPTSVWEDPYAIGIDRIGTDRTAQGFRLGWDRVAERGIRFQYTFRDVNIDSERSGTQLELEEAGRAQLDRSGQSHQFEALYRLWISDTQRLTPALQFAKDDRRGRARARTILDGELNYIYTGKRITWAVNGLLGIAEHEGENPIYEVTQRDKRYGLTVTGYYLNPWGWRFGSSSPIRLILTGGGYSVDSNIDFHEQKGVLGQAGFIVRW